LADIFSLEKRVMRTNRLIAMVMATAMFTVAAVARAADYKEGDKGTYAGTVSEKEANWIRVKKDTGSEKFVPKWIGGMPKDGGGFDKEMVAKIKELKAGDKVEVKWEFSEHLRAVEIKVTEAAKTDAEK
jgi:hypothetical protein